MTVSQIALSTFIGFKLLQFYLIALLLIWTHLKTVTTKFREKSPGWSFLKLFVIGMVSSTFYLSANDYMKVLCLLNCEFIQVLYLESPAMIFKSSCTMVATSWRSILLPPRFGLLATYWALYQQAFSVFFSFELNWTFMIEVGCTWAEGILAPAKPFDFGNTSYWSSMKPWKLNLKMLVALFPFHMFLWSELYSKLQYVKVWTAGKQRLDLKPLHVAECWPRDFEEFPSIRILCGFTSSEFQCYMLCNASSLTNRASDISEALCPG